MSSDNPIRLLIVDDHQLVIDGLKAIFSADDTLQIVGIANTGKEAIRLLDNIAVDLVLTDIDMPEMGGIDLTKTIKSGSYACKVIVMTMHDEKPLVKEIIQTGAEGFLLKTASSDQMLFAVHTVIKGNQYFSPDVTQIIMQPDAPQKSKSEVDLSEREIEILQLIAEGFSNKEIGEKIFISHRTVDKHRANMMRKIGARNVAELVRYAMKNDLIN